MSTLLDDIQKTKQILATDEHTGPYQISVPEGDFAMNADGSLHETLWGDFDAFMERIEIDTAITKDE